MSGDQLRVLRERAGLTQSALAEELGVSQQALSRWEREGPPRQRARKLDMAKLHETLELPGDELRALRKRRSMSQSDLAGMLGVTRQVLGGWERDGGPPASRIRELRELLGEPPPDGAALRTMRERAGWRQEDLAGRAGVSTSNVGRWERGEAPTPQRDWPRVRRVLEEAPPAEEPVSTEELLALLRKLNYRHGDLAEQLGITRPAVAVWASGRQRVPPRHWAKLRELARSGERRPEPDAVADALPAVLEAINDEPGLSREEIIARVNVADGHRIARKAITRAVEQRLAHERPVDRLRSAPGLFPGPPEREPGRPITAPELGRMRTEAGLTVAELARDLHVDQASVRGWEAGRQDVPQWRRAQLRAALGL
jgi:transcriptional regulator with XRE-family HTH domain